MSYSKPAREAEKLAEAVVRGWVGSDGIVTDLSAAYDADFRIDYSDGRAGIGVVIAHIDPATEAMWVISHHDASAEDIELAPGLGTWTILLREGASSKALHRRAGAFISRLRELGVASLFVPVSGSRDELVTTAMRLGIEYVTSTPESMTDLCHCLMPPSGGVYGVGPDVIPEWLEHVLGSETYSDVTEKLLTREAAERHLFLLADAATDFAPANALQQLHLRVPMRPPVLPVGITHLWAIGRYGPLEGSAALWEERSGWTAVPVPPGTY